MQKIAIAISGGVDSSVAAYLLKEAGYEVLGVNLNLAGCYGNHLSKTCCGPEDRQDARRVCEFIKIPFISLDMRDIFREKIVIPFVEEYCRGRTPNPCIRCNTIIKFDHLRNWLQQEMGISKLATGHYARIIGENGTFHLMKGIDESKDQSYFLFDIPSAVLGYIDFPVGGYTKETVRKIAVTAGLPVAEKRESQEVCFIRDGDVASFIENYFSSMARPSGNFVDAGGCVLGRHRGTHAYTIGQRRGLGVGFGKRLYVGEIRPEEGEVVLTEDEDLYKTRCNVKDVRLVENLGGVFKAGVKIRYRSESIMAEINFKSEEGAEILFAKPVRAITPGQAVVFYKNDLVLGGGWID